MDEQAKTSIVRIYKRLGSKLWPIGCGFLVDSRSILTCWHVVRDALLPEKYLLGKEVELDFPFPKSSSLLKAKVILVFEQPDLARLELLSDPPEKATPMPLSMEMNLWRHPYSAFGITSERPEGCLNDGEIKSSIADGTIQLESKSLFKVEKGFSGTAIWDDQIKKAVGMMVMIESDQETKAAYAIPMADLLEKCPELKSLIAGVQPSKWSDTPHQIPSPPADFTGREGEINDILSNFDKGATIIGLRGMGGIGKTVLAFKLAERLENRFPDGQCFIDLQGMSKSPVSPDTAMAQVIRAYRPRERIPDNLNELRGLYLSVLAGKRTLLLLDNVASKEQVESLLPPKSCAVLITSRNRFTLPGLKKKNINVFPPASAKALLLEIAERIDDKAEELAKLCGYLPFALRNAASVLAEREDISVDKYERLLHDKKERLGLVEASFSLSYDLLTPIRRIQWCRLSVFPGFFGTDGADAVLNMVRDDSAKVLSDLVKWSLLDFIPSANSEDGRYKLHDLARLFAESRLESDEGIDAQQRHAEYYLNVLFSVKQLYRQGKKDALIGLKLFDQEWENIRIGQAWAETMVHHDGIMNSAILDTDLFLYLASYYPITGLPVLNLRLPPHTRIRWLETALIAASQRRDTVSKSVILNGMGRAYIDLGKTEEAIEYYEQSLVIARETGNRQGEGASLAGLGRAFAELGKTEKAIEYYEQSLVIARETGNRQGEGASLAGLGRAYAELGKTENAIEYFEQALPIARETGNRQGEGTSLAGLGRAYAELGKTEKAIVHLKKAIEYFEQALPIAREIGNRQGEGASLAGLGWIYAEMGKTEKAIVHSKKAIEYFEQALPIARELGNRQSEGASSTGLGWAYAELGKTEKAIEYCEQSLVIARELGNRQGEGTSLGGLGRAYAELGKTEKAIEYYERSLVIARELGNRQGEGTSLAGLGRAYAELGKTEKAIEYFEQALVISQKIRNRNNIEANMASLTKAYSKLGDKQKAIVHYEQKLKIARESNNNKQERTIMDKLASIYIEQGETQEAIKLYEQIITSARADKNHMQEKNILDKIGLTYAKQGETHKAIEYFKQELVMARVTGDQNGELNSLDKIRAAYVVLGEMQEVVKLDEQILKIAFEALTFAQKVKHHNEEKNILGKIGMIYAKQGKTQKAIEYFKHATDKAIECFEQSLTIACKTENRHGEGASLAGLGWAYAELGKTEKAIKYYEQSLVIAREIGNRYSEAIDLIGLGLAYAELGKTEKAIGYYEKSLAISREIKNQRIEGENLCYLGKAYSDLNEANRAVECCMQSLDLVRKNIVSKIDYRRVEGEALCNLGKVQADLGENNKAIDFCDQALEIFKQIKYYRGIGDALFYKSLALEKLDQRRNATDSAKAALDIFEQIGSPCAMKVRQKMAEW